MYVAIQQGDRKLKKLSSIVFDEQRALSGECHFKNEIDKKKLQPFL